MKLLSAIGLFLFVNYSLNAQQIASTPEDSPSTREILKTEGSCDHESNSMKRFEDIRILPVVRIDMFNGTDLTYRHPDLKGIHILNIDKRTAMPDEFSKTYRKRLWWIVYSTCDNHIDLIAEPAPRQLYGAKSN